jgi:hypothetical protein
MVAHIGGVPIEESLPWLIPIGGLGIAGSIAWARERARVARHRVGATRNPRPGTGKRGIR